MALREMLYLTLCKGGSRLLEITSLVEFAAHNFNVFLIIKIQILKFYEELTSLIYIHFLSLI
jgi:hypothetical protein